MGTQREVWVSSGRFRVHRQHNGARVVVSDGDEVPSDPDVAGVFTGEDEDTGPSEPDEIDRFARRLAARGTVRQPLPASAGWWRRWRRSVALGVVTTIACVIVTDVIAFVAGSGFKLVVVACGTAIALAVRTGIDPGARLRDRNPRRIALSLTYLCVASAYAPWFLDELLHPERYVTLTSVAAAPPRVTPAVAIATSLLRAVALPIELTLRADGLGLLCLVAALAQAWKLAVVRDRGRTVTFAP